MASLAPSCSVDDAAALHVHSMCDRFEMCWIHAERVAAQVIQFPVWWYRPHQEHVGEAMSLFASVLDPTRIDQIAVPGAS